MPDLHENPFANYEPPELPDVFSVSGKIAIIEFKVERLVNRVKRELLRNDGVEQFLSGTDYTLDYDCTGLENLISLSQPEGALNFVASGVTAGLTAAMKAKRLPVNGAVGIGGEFKDEPPRTASITAHFIDLGSEQE
jgi:hypothetical protein